MSSVEKLIRASLRQWIAERPWSTAPTVTADEPEPGAKPALPTLACWFDRVDVPNATPVEIAPGVFHTGDAEAAVTFLFRVGDEEVADNYRREWRDLVWTAAMDASPSGDSPVMPLTITVAGVARLAKLYLDGSLELAPFEDAQIRGLWLVRAFGRLVFPALAIRAASKLMTVGVQIDGTEYQASDFQAPRVLSSTPAANGSIEVTDPIELVFDQPMNVDLVEAATGGLDVEPSGDLMTFAVAPTVAWAIGANTFTLAASARSKRGTPLGADFTLNFNGVAP